MAKGERSGSGLGSGSDKQLRSLLNRIQSKIRTCAPTDEASASIGHQIGYIYLSMYIQTQTQTQSSDTRSSDKSLDEWKSRGYEIIELLGSGTTNSGDGNNTINRGVVTGFFSGLTCTEDLLIPYERDGGGDYEDFIHWFLKCITTCEESGYVHVLEIAIRYFAKFAHRYVRNFYIMGKIKLQSNSNSGSSNCRETMPITTDASNDYMHLAHLYQKCKLSTTRQCLIRECIHSAFHLDDNYNRNQPSPLCTVMIILSPLFCVSVVSAQLSNSVYTSEAEMFVSCLMRECRSQALRQSPASATAADADASTEQYQTHDIWDLISWLTEVIHLMFQSSMPQNNTDHVRAALVIGYDFICDLCEICTLALIRRDDIPADSDGGAMEPNNDDATTSKRKKVRVINTFLDVVMGKILPYFTMARTLNLSLTFQPLLHRLLDVCNLIFHSKIQMMHSASACSGNYCVSDSTIYKLSTMCLELDEQEDVSCILKAISLVLQNGKESKELNLKSYGQLVWGCACSLGYIFQSVAPCSQVASNLAHQASSVLSTNSGQSECKDTIQNVDSDIPRHVFDLFNQDTDMFEVFADSLSLDITPMMSVKDQCEYLLLGVSMICISMYEDGEISDHIYKYISKLTVKCPHLGRRVLPVLVPSLREPTKDFCRVLKFMCESLSGDASCAHEIWSLLHPMTTANVPIKLRCMAVRLYPVLCNSNKRLYSRIYESMGTIASHPNAQLRIAASATIYDLAKFDLIRDVTDVIGWIQSFLTDEENLVAYYSIMALHHLIEAEELDYSMVIKVLNKKLVNVDDASAILDLPDIVVEALVQLLGDGEEGGHDDSESEGSSSSNDESEIMVSQQVQSSVTALTDLALTLSKSILSRDNNTKYFPMDTTLRLLQSIYTSLGRYSLTSIGIMAEMVRSETSDTEEYDTMKSLIQNAIMVSLTHNAGDIEQFDEALVVMAKKILLFEQESLLLWPHQRKTTSASKYAEMRQALESIQNPLEGTLAHLITKFLQSSMDDEAGNICGLQFSLALECLQDLSLPSPFIAILNTALEANLGVKSIVKRACIRTLNAQLRIHRRSSSERRDYIKYSITCAQLPSDSLQQMFGSFIPLFINSLDVIIPQWTAGIVEETLPILWKNSRQLGQEATIEFLQTLQKILNEKLESTNASVAKAIFDTLVNVIFPAIHEYENDQSNGAQSLLYSCMSKVPIDVLEESKIFTFGDAITDVARAGLITHLVSCRYFTEQRLRLYFLQAAVWIAKQKTESAHLSKLCLKLATASSSVQVETRKDLISALFENMVVNGMDNFSLELLLFNVSMRINGFSIKSNLLFEPKKLFTLQLNEGPHEVGKLAHKLGMADSIGRSTLNLFPRKKNSDCIASIFSSSNNTETPQLQHALISASLALFKAL